VGFSPAAPKGGYNLEGEVCAGGGEFSPPTNIATNVTKNKHFAGGRNTSPGGGTLRRGEEHTSDAVHKDNAIIFNYMQKLLLRNQQCEYS